MGSVFPHPIALLAHNRPDYLVQVLQSLDRQTTPPDLDRMVVHLDAYAGSSDEARGRPDATDRVAALVSHHLDGATVVRADRNRGIARAYDDVEQRVFGDASAGWAVFLEDDMVLDPRYLETLAWLIREVEPHPEIAAVSASGDCYVDKVRGEQTYYPMHFSWGCAVRRHHWLASRPFIEAYLAALDGVRYSERDHDAVYTALAALGVFPAWSAQDAVKEAVRRRLGAMAITTGVAYGTYVGKVGETFTPELFAARGFADPPDSVSRPTWSAPVTDDVLLQVRDEEEQSFARRATRNLVVGRTLERQRISRLLERVARLQDRIAHLRPDQPR